MCKSTEPWPMWPMVSWSSVGAGGDGPVMRGERALSSLLGQDLVTGVIPGLKKARGRGEGRAGKEEDSWGKWPSGKGNERECGVGNLG